MDCDRGDKLQGSTFCAWTVATTDLYILDFNSVFFLNMFIEALENER